MNNFGQLNKRTRTSAGTAGTPPTKYKLICYQQIHVSTYVSLTIQYASDLDFDLSKSPTVNSDGDSGLPMHDFLFAFNSNSAHLQDLKLSKSESL